MAEGDAGIGIGPGAVIVGSPVGDSRRHAGRHDRQVLLGSPASAVDHASESAHGLPGTPGAATYR
jgi:hypothetical protein